jgi:hypothetical protein
METTDDMNRWLFAFQKSVARVLTSIIERRSQSESGVIYEMLQSSAASGTTTEYSEGGEITRNTSFARMDSTVTTTRAYTDEDVVGRASAAGMGTLRISVPGDETSPRPPHSGHLFENTPRFAGTTPQSSRTTAGSFGASADGGGGGGGEHTVFGLSDSLLTLSQKNYVPPTQMSSSYASSHSGQGLPAAAGAAVGGGSAHGGSLLGSSLNIPIAMLDRHQPSSHHESEPESTYVEKLSSSFSAYKEQSEVGIMQYSQQETAMAHAVVHREGALDCNGSPPAPFDGRSRASSASSDAASPDTRRSSDVGTPNDTG